MFGVLDNRFLARSVGLLNPPEPVCLPEGALIAEALSALKQNKIGAIVIENADGAISGIFTERDVVLKLKLEECAFANLPVTEFMTKEPKCLSLTSSIAYALTLMSSGGYRHIPLVDDDMRVVGILSVKNIVDYIVRELLSDLEALSE